MRSMPSKFAAALVAVCLLFGLFAAPVAQAQVYNPVAPAPAGPDISVQELLAIINAQRAGQGTVLIVTGDGAVVILAPGLRPLVINVKITIFSMGKVVYDAKPPANGKIDFSLAGIAPGVHRVEVMSTLSSGQVFNENFTITIGATAPSVPLPQLAFTGSSVNTPLALGTLLIGAGGLVLLTARKRERSL